MKEKPQEETKGEPKKKEQKQKQQQKGGGKQQAMKEVHDLSLLDLRVGKVVKVYPNPQSDKLYNEEVDIGNGEVRNIASGL